MVLYGRASGISSYFFLYHDVFVDMDCVVAIK